MQNFLFSHYSALLRLGFLYPYLEICRLRIRVFKACSRICIRIRGKVGSGSGRNVQLQSPFRIIEESNFSFYIYHNYNKVTRVNLGRFLRVESGFFSRGSGPVFHDGWIRIRFFLRLRTGSRNLDVWIRMRVTSTRIRNPDEERKDNIVHCK